MNALAYILVGLLAFAPVKEEWVKISGDPYITFLFPNRGERLKKNVNGMRSWIFQTKNTTCVFGVVCTRLAKEGAELDTYTINQLYLAMKKASVEMPTTVLRSEKTLPSKHMEIREIKYTIVKDGREMTYYRRFIFRGNCMYQITIGAYNDDLAELEVQKKKFFDSVSFREKES